MKTRSSILVIDMAKKPLVEDSDNMIEIMSRLAYREEIWQDRFIYWIAKALWDVLQELLKAKDNKCVNCEYRYDCFPYSDATLLCQKGEQHERMERMGR